MNTLWLQIIETNAFLYVFGSISHYTKMLKPKIHLRYIKIF